MRAGVAAVATFSIFAGAAAAADELGIDVSSHQHPKGASIDWAAVKADGVAFAFVKATEGRTYTNPYFAGDWAATRSVGLYHGAYHFARPSSGTAAAQARYFVSRAGLADQPGDLPPVLDLEVTGNLGVKALRTWTTTWLTTVEELTGRKPIIYTSPYFWKTYMGNSTAFTAYPLWIAHYGVSQPSVPGGWSTWAFWQGNSTGRVTGISGNVDMNAFNGSLAQLAALANGPLPAPAPSPDDGQPGTTPSDAQRSPAKVVTVTSLATNRAGVYRRQVVTLSGDLRTDSGDVLSDRKVVLRSQAQGQATWTRVAVLKTDASGRFVARAMVPARTRYRAVYLGATRYARSLSPLREVAITPKTATAVQLAASRASTKRGRPVKLFGRLTTTSGAALPMRQVRYFVRPAGSRQWTRIAVRTSAAPSGSHQLVVRPSKTSVYKVVHPGAMRFGWSRSVLVKVKAR
jgi:GH25 family lysozyme M1 (1,4-beta-N-acetylmuramidase)